MKKEEVVVSHRTLVRTTHMTPSKLWVSASLLAREAQYELHQCSHMFIQHVNNLPDQNGLKAHVDQQTKDRNEDRKYFGYASKSGTIRVHLVDAPPSSI